MPILERSSSHLATLASEVLAASPHQAKCGMQLVAIAMLLLQASRRVRLAHEVLLIEDGNYKQQLASNQFDFVEALDEALAHIAPLFAGIGVELRADLTEDPLVVEVDCPRLVDTLRDLLLISLAMTASGDHVQVTVTLEGEQVLTSITDTGLGMSSEELEVLFTEKGTHPVLDDYTGGVRDGLFVARSFLEASGGRLEASSKPGVGTVFSIHLPLA